MTTIDVSKGTIVIPISTKGAPLYYFWGLIYMVHMVG